MTSNPDHDSGDHRSAPAATSSGDRVLEALLEYQTALEAGGAPDRQEFLIRYADVAAELAAALDGLECLHSAARHLQPTNEPDTAAAGVPLGDYQIVREVGRGGMGIVYEAVQLSLGRRVALKVLPFAAALDPRQLQRFKLEAQAAALLHHPNVVPIHAVGCERGVHFYVMQYVEGRSLTALIQEQRQPRRDESAPPIASSPASTQALAVLATEPVPEGREFYRTAASLGLQAAEALEHAHREGVIHRDVKPANLLVDGNGKLWVTDFGLARVQGDAGQTLTGDVIGTLRYMSPEQASGQKERVTHRADLYSLGVTLYELLALEPAFPSHDRQELLRQILNEEPRPLRRLNPAIPADLETIVHKAMAKAPEERYATAQEFADDLRRFLEDRPVLARRPTRLHQARKWARRHRRALTALLATLVVGVMAGLSVGVVLLWRQQQQTEAARQAEADQRQRAEDRERLARQAADDMTRAAMRWLDTKPGMTDVQREFLEKALAISEALYQQNSTDPPVRHATAQAYFRVGSIQQRLGRHTRAVQAYEQCVGLWQELADEFPREPAYRLDLYRSHMTLSGALACAGHHPEALRARRRTLALVVALSADFPDDHRYRDAVANQGYDLGSLLASHGQFQEAETIHKQALAVAERLVKEFPQQLRYPRNVALNLLSLGDIYRATGRTGRAEEAYVQALGLFKELAAHFPDERAYRVEVARCQYQTGGLIADAGRLAEAEKLFLEALPVAKELAKDFPKEFEFPDFLRGVQCRLGHLYLAAGRAAEAEVAFRQYVAVLEGLIAEFPEKDGYKNELARFLSVCPTPQVRNPRRAVDLARQALEQVPASHDYRRNLAIAHYRADDWKACVATLEEIKPAASDYYLDACFFLAMAHWRLNDLAKARQCYDWGARRMEKVAPGDEELRRFRAEAAALLGLPETPKPDGDK